MDYRITVTFDAPEGFSGDHEEIIRNGIGDILNEQLAENIKIRLEDRSCTGKNDRLDHRREKRSGCGNSGPSQAMAKDRTELCVNCVIRNIAERRSQEDRHGLHPEA